VIDIFFEISATDWSEIVRNYTLAGAAFLTAWLAWSGFQAWKKQKLWEDSRDISRQALLKSFLYLNSINQLRFPPRSEIEKQIITKDRSQLNDVEKAIVRSINSSLEKDLDELKTLEAEFQSTMMEASFLLESFPSQDFAAAEKAAVSVKRAAMARAYILRYPEAISEDYADLKNHVESKIITFSTSDDVFGKELIGAFVKLHQSLKQHLGHNK